MGATVKKNAGDRGNSRDLRRQAQIALLRRALLAAEDESLPHRAVCDYLKILIQMAKAEPSKSVAARGHRSGAAHCPSKADPSTATGVDEDPAAMRRLLNEAIRDIYGVEVTAAPASNADESPKA